MNIQERLHDFVAWSSLTREDVNANIADLLALLPRPMEHLQTNEYSSGMVVPTFVDPESDVRFNLIPGGQTMVGLSRHEYDAAMRLDRCRVDVLQRLPPARAVTLQPFLLSQTPLLESFVASQLDLDETLFRPEFGDEESEDVPVYVTMRELKHVLREFGFSLPTGIQWEHAIRGGTSSLFYFGDSLPDNETLSKILATGFTEEIFANPAYANPFGLYGSLVGVWCRDGEDAGGLTEDRCIVKGGGATFWPWHGMGEWMLCMPAMQRSPRELEDGTCAAHVTLPLRPDVSTRL